MKVWITKYALTSGILEADDATVAQAAPGMISVPSLGLHAHFHRDEWHTVRENAVLKAEQMRTSKLASLRKQIAKLESIQFK